MTEHVFGRLAHAAAAGALLVGIAFGAGARADSFTMGYSVGFLTDPFQAIQVDLSMQGAKAAGLKTLPVANANGDPGKQITDIHNLIAQGVQGIILVPTDSDAIVPALNFAASKNVPVVSIDIGPAG
ncbi:MAG: substrate-binding domain-containing protein, partial [Methylobacteriaceae bacterium]|nr:substrate-binding domain-containing protein [Methylobacteriaceae bacterium]